MINALLRSGDIKDFKILGHDGKAAYLVATQIREMFRVKLGKKYADFLAIPQRNDHGNIIDWYIPFDSNQSDGQYDIVPWTSASETEQSSTLILLKEFEQQVVNLGKQLANNPNLTGDQLLFSRLIYDPKHDTTSSDPNLMAIRFPGNDFVYIVDGKPVITFWGFINSQTPQASSPFYCLEPVKKDASIIPPVKMQKPWWKRWWVWLLGLLLLLLLLLAIFWLRGCGLKPQLPVDPKPLLDDKSNASLPTVVDEQQNKKDFELKENIDRQNGVINTVKPNVTTSIDTNELPIIVDGKDQSIADVGKNDSNNNLPLDAQPNIDEQANNADTNNTGNKDEQTNPVDSDKKDNSDVKKENENNVQTPQPLDKNNNPDVNSDTNQSNNLALPEDAMKQGSTKFLDGQWNVGAGIQDEATGKPLQLTYNFNQGNGEVTITRSDGVKCVGKVGSGVENANLNIFSNTEAICSDNTKYQLPKIQCKSSNNNQADCQGIYNNGISFPITMKKQ
ncbi:SrfA family protein [uncultured Gilliamella sp.]|uniref:SrfA family protein n=1 Tax=uncultured Gilliamella sp. TaxID=1193505 RepID=UPI0025D5C725|nr:SrfA family protein [uncultured Gilliamella sp.]